MPDHAGQQGVHHAATLPGWVGGGRREGPDETPLPAERIEALQALLDESSLGETSLRGRYSVIVLRPGPGNSGGPEVVRFVEEAPAFRRLGVQVLGLSARGLEPPEGIVAFPFSIGVLPSSRLRRVAGELAAPGVGGDKGATSVVFADGTGVGMAHAGDPAGHVRRCLDLVTAHRLDVFRRRATAGLFRDPDSLLPMVELADAERPGPGPGTVLRVELRLGLACSLAEPVRAGDQAGYMAEMNRLLAAHGRLRLFPEVVAVSAGEDPGWILTADPGDVSLAEVVFADREGPRLDPAGLPALSDALIRLTGLHGATCRPAPQTPDPRHVLRPFSAPGAPGLAEGWHRAFGTSPPLEVLLGSRIVPRGGRVHPPYVELMSALERHLPQLQPRTVACVHGDARLANALLDRGGRRTLFVGPRAVGADGEHRDRWVGDPLGDLATLLADLHVLSPVRRAIEDGEAEALPVLEAAGGSPPSFAVASGAPTSPVESPAAGWLLEWIERHVPVEVLGEGWRPRLYTRTASVLLERLAADRWTRTPGAWTAAFVGAVAHLDAACRELRRRSR